MPKTLCDDWRKSLAATCLLAALAALPAARAAGTVDVSFVNAGQFSDAGRGLVDRERTLKSLADHLRSLGPRLADGQTLRVEVLDVDLAGEIEPVRTDELRILRGRADWPRINLRFRLSAGEQSLKSGEQRIADMNYLSVLRGHDLRQIDLAYEKRMLTKWFDESFVTY